MYSRDYRDIISGGVLTAFGIWFAWYAITHYGRGTMTNVGDGLFPAALGALLALLGTAIVTASLRRQGSRLSFRFREPVLVILGVATFASTITTFGLIPAVCSVTILSSLADRNVRPVGLLGLCVVLCAMVYLIFVVGLRLAIPMFTWPH